jgi:hypothetical protein
MAIEGKCIVIMRRPDECLPAKEDAVPPEGRSALLKEVT